MSCHTSSILLSRPPPSRGSRPGFWYWKAQNCRLATRLRNQYRAESHSSVAGAQIFPPSSADLSHRALSCQLRAQAHDPSHGDDRGKGEYNRGVSGNLGQGSVIEDKTEVGVHSP